MIKTADNLPSHSNFTQNVLNIPKINLFCKKVGQSFSVGQTTFNIGLLNEINESRFSEQRKLSEYFTENIFLFVEI